jgi:oligogalacturonide lyase
MNYLKKFKEIKNIQISNGILKTSRKKIIVVFILFFLPAKLLFAQVINGVDYSSRSEVDHTFDMAGEDNFGYRFASENYTYKDEVTGVTVNALTTSRHKSSKIYQTHPQWTSDGKYIVFLSNRTKNEDGPKRQYYAVSTENFEIVQITTGEGVDNLHVGWKDNMAFYFKGKDLIEFNLGKLLKDSETRTVGNVTDYEKVLYTIPEDLDPSGVGLDASQESLFFSNKKDDSHYEIYNIDFKNKKITKTLDIPYRIGHLQANPYKSGELMYCWETGGDAPQRIWYVTIDKNGKATNKALYNEKDNDWVTHEVFMGPDRVLFHLMGHIDRLNDHQTGIYSIKTDNTDLQFHGQTDGGGYWHCNATPDAKWIAGDTFDGKLYRINANNPKDVVLLTQGHRSGSRSPFSNEPHLHQSVSPDGKWILFNSSFLTENDIMLVPMFPDNLKKTK